MNFKAAEAAPALKKVLPTVRDTFLVVLEDDHDAELSAHVVDGRKLF